MIQGSTAEAGLSRTLRLSPQGRLLFAPEPDAPPLSAALAKRLEDAFARGAGAGLFHLGAAEVGVALPALLDWWRAFAARYVTALCGAPDEGEGSSTVAVAVAAPDPVALAAWVEDAPPMLGEEYLAPNTLAALWAQMHAAAMEALAASGRPLQEFLSRLDPAWNVVGRVHFNLAENRKDAECPFAFLATYTPRLSAQGKAQHMPLSRALEEFAGRRAQLLSLLLPVQRAAGRCAWLADMVAAGDIYHSLRWTPQEALKLLADVPALTASGIVVRLPGQWKSGRPARPAVKATLGSKQPSLLGLNALMDFRMEVSLDGETLTAAEVAALQKNSEGLQFLRGRWVEVDRAQLDAVLARFRSIEAAADGLPFAQAMRLMAGAALEDDAAATPPDWAQVSAGPWLAQTLKNLRAPESLAQIDPGPELKAELRPYQQAGVRWLYLLSRLGLGACLADDMGLGKTVQVLALLLVLKREQSPPRPSILVAPASLLANWAAEAARFTPGLKLLIAHPSTMPMEELRALDAARVAAVDLVVTSYGTLLRSKALTELRWRLAITDEAQAIKNPAAKQTRQVKKLLADQRIALTGTPVENRLSDLWSLFDFTHPGLLGSEKVFAAFSKQMVISQHYAPLRALVRPYILRRLKTDKQVIADLPAKTEVKSWCALSPAQAALYAKAVDELTFALTQEAATDDMARRGLVLSYLLRFKQICNHPSQWLNDGAWQDADSGKFARLRELVEVIAAKQEKLLVFTQFRETIEPLAAFLGQLFGRAGLVLHGGTPVAKRRERVEVFQEDELIPFFILSLKAGGAGLNLTAAAHVIHFDRWWNPAVENQATDRAFRIGQKKNVLVHKFICKGTVEERIDALIESKQHLARDLLEQGAGDKEIKLTELSDRELLDLVKLDINAINTTS